MLIYFLRDTLSGFEKGEKLVGEIIGEEGDGVKFRSFSDNDIEFTFAREDFALVENPRYWSGEEPGQCDICERPFKEGKSGVFCDGRTRRNYWALMCYYPCFQLLGVGLGTGHGQRYEWDRTCNKWAKTAG